MTVSSSSYALFIILRWQMSFVNAHSMVIANESVPPPIISYNEKHKQCMNQKIYTQ